MNSRTFLILITIMMLLGLTGLSADGYSRVTVPTYSGSSTGFLEALQSANRMIADKVLPVVVSIDVSSTIRFETPRYSSPFDAFEFFFRDRNAPPQQKQEEEEEPSYTEREQRGAGSGIIVRRDRKTYYVITNNHVAGEADRIVITLYSGDEYKAELVGNDPRKDIALIKFESDKDLPVAEMGDSNDVMPGDLVYAVGNPLGFESTFTSGIVSAVKRKGGPQGSRGFTDYIQTDAPINQGNSGGALVNIYGEVVGINTWIASQTGGSVGIGFAIPVNNVKSAIDSFITEGKVEYGWLGISIGDPTEENRKELGIENRKGSLVQNVYLGSPADKDGILPGDYITKVEENAISGTDELVQIVAGLAPGSTYRFELIRSGRQEQVNVRIAERDAETEINRNENRLYPGLTVEGITDEIRSRLDLAKNAGDVIVGYVWENSPAGKAGLRPGDIIKEVNRNRIRSVQDFFSSLNKTDDNEVLFRVNRGGQNILLGIVKE
ncbi:MAG: Do family serine endopeptidase [Spirochaetales bacterium]|nr:Do family serine endopeptidase [Spirochaetales bacterium]